MLILHSIFVSDEGIQTRGSHKGCPDGFDFFNIFELWLVQQIVKVTDQLVENSEKLFASHVGLVVEFIEVDEAGEDDTNVFVVFRILGRFLQLIRDVAGDDIVEEPISLNKQS